MTTDKTVSMSFQVSARFKALLEASAAQEHRSMTNLLETLIFAHCDKQGFVAGAAGVGKTGAKK